MDDIINEWNAELERRSRSFVKHAEALAQVSMRFAAGRLVLEAVHALWTRFGPRPSCVAPCIVHTCKCCLLRGASCSQLQPALAAYCSIFSLPVLLLPPCSKMWPSCPTAQSFARLPCHLCSSQWDAAILSNR